MLARNFNKSNRRRSAKSTKVVKNPVKEFNAKTAENFAALRIVEGPKGPNNKYINTVYNQVAGTNITNSAPLVTTLNAVAQGTSENTRIGRLVKNKWIDIDIRVNAINGSIVTQAVPGYRIYVVAESSCLGAAVNPAQFFVDATIFTPLSQRDRTNRNASRYVVFWDSGPNFLCTASATGSGTQNSMAAGPPVHFYSKHIELPFMTDYSRGNAGTVADIDTNSLCLIVVTDDATSNQIYIDAAWTLCFNDDS
jgi:hypothetical protein